MTETKFAELYKMENVCDIIQFYNDIPGIYFFDLCEDAFLQACENGSLDIAQWLLSFKPDINISAKNEYAFRKACKNGHLTVAQWLLNIKPNINISAKNEYAFCKACKNEHLEVVNWILSIKPNSR
jgi:ankyrin repeat protein